MLGSILMIYQFLIGFTDKKIRWCQYNSINMILNDFKNVFVILFIEV